MILGSGMGGVADAIENPTIVPYKDIPNFPRSTVHGHSGQLVCGSLCGVDVMCFQGRVHMYEGIDPASLRVPIYALKLLGCEALMITSAVGSLRTEVGAGELVLLNDHINMQGRNPLVGPNDPIGPRFPGMMDAYDPGMRERAHAIAKENNIRVTDGVVLSVLGPMFETPAEIRAYRTLGADVVGMSTVAEITLARHADMKCLAFGVVVNLASGMQEVINHEETLHFAGIASPKVETMFKGLLADRSWEK